MDFTQKRSQYLSCPYGASFSVGENLQKHEVASRNIHRYEKKRMLYASNRNIAPSNVGLEENVTCNADTYDNYGNQDLLKVFLARVLELV